MPQVFTGKDGTSSKEVVRAVNASKLSSFRTGTSPGRASAYGVTPPLLDDPPEMLISLGESPPTQPSSYEDNKRSPRWTTKEQRGTLNGHPPSLSPPGVTRRRPVSYYLEGTIPHGQDEYPTPPKLSYAMRPSSLYSQYPQNARFGPHPPLPHQVQPHFYGAPDADLLLSPKCPGLTPGEHGYHCGFDVLPASLQNGSSLADNIVVTGYEGGINVYKFTKRGLSQVVTLDGLRGAVFHAKILPWALRGGSAHHIPLVALVVHGPACISTEAARSERSDSTSDLRSMPSNESIRSPSRRPGRTVADRNGTTVEHFQTTVEIYSLSTKKHINTLLSLPKLLLSVSTMSYSRESPPPSGSLSIHADGGNVIVSSGTTGETWLFRQHESKSPQISFRCLGKLWTTIQHGLVGDGDNADNDWQSTSNHHPTKLRHKASTLSLNGRWLAYCPPAPSSQTSLRATSEVPQTGRASFTTLAAPQVPPVNCMVDTPGGESMIKGMAKTAMRGISQGAAFAGGYWNNYWNKMPNQLNGGGNSHHTQANLAHQFPPTHAASSQDLPVIKDPGIISILDLDSLACQSSLHGLSPHPLATFKAPHGISFLSFAPDGLSLFTASSKGDLQFIWDLMRLQHAKSSLLNPVLPISPVQGPHVRQVAQFSRMTVARIVDVAWSSPHGERAAMVTEPGTVHFVEVPATAFTWPPPRRKILPPKAEEETSNSAASTISVGGAALTGAVSSLWNTARPFVKQQRRRSSGGMSSITAANVTAQAGHGTQALVAGISRSVGAATGKMNEIRKSVGTKLHLPRSSTSPTMARSGCVRILDSSMAVLGAGIIRFAKIRNRSKDGTAEKRKSRGKISEFRLPTLPESSQEIPHDLDQDDLDLDSQRDAENTKVRKAQAATPLRARKTESSIPQAEIESNAPYQPFHTDRRVGLHAYLDQEEPQPSSPSVSALLSQPIASGASESISSTPWAFGGQIKSAKLDVGPPHDMEEEDTLSLEHRALPPTAMERIMKVADGNEDMEQIVVTTRRRKGANRVGTIANEDADEEGFFEDDCEVLDFASQRV